MAAGWWAAITAGWPGSAAWYQIDATGRLGKVDRKTAGKAAVVIYQGPIGRSYVCTLRMGLGVFGPGAGCA